MTVRVGINGFGRIGRNYLRAAKGTGRRGRRRQRPDRQQVPGPPAQVRLDLRPAGRRGVLRRRVDHRRRPADRGQRPAGPGPAPLGRPRGRRGHRVHRPLHQARRRRPPPQGRGQEGHHLGPGQGRGRHHRHGRQPRQVRPGQPRHHLQRLLHHQLGGPPGQGPARQLRDREGLHDHHPRLHQRPGHPRLPAQGPAPGPLGGGQHHPHLDRRGQGRLPGHPRAQGQARRHRPAGPGGGRLAHRPGRGAEPRHHRRGDQRRLQAGRRGAAARGSSATPPTRSSPATSSATTPPASSTRP